MEHRALPTTVVVARQEPVVGHFRAPPSKPDTQRALLLAALADGASVIDGPLVSRETEAMARACRALGARVAVSGERFAVEGIGGRGGPGGARYVWAAGSALVGRLFAAIGSAVPDRVVVDGNCNLRGRPFGPLFAALAERGVRFEFFDGEGRLPCATLAGELPGGRYRLATSVSSQFATALLVPAPLARAATTVELTGPLHSLPYIRQTVEMMRRFGVPVLVGEGEREIAVPGGTAYRGGRAIAVAGDYTSASYILGAAFATRGRVTVGNLDPGSLQGERAVVGILEGLGARATWTPGEPELTLDCGDLPDEVDAAFDLRDCPNILPTVAAVAATVRGRVRLTGARLTEFHKSPRVSAMAAELTKAGVAARVLRAPDGAIDGLEIEGRRRPAGGAVLSGYGDHRVLMSLALLALACERPCTLDGADTADSFPGFGRLLGVAAEAEGEGRRAIPAA